MIFPYNFNKFLYVCCALNGTITCFLLKFVPKQDFFNTPRYKAKVSGNHSLFFLNTKKTEKPLVKLSFHTQKKYIFRKKWGTFEIGPTFLLFFNFLF